MHACGTYFRYTCTLHNKYIIEIYTVFGNTLIAVIAPPFQSLNIFDANI